MSGQVERVLRVGGALDGWRREMERKGEDWKEELLKTFKDVIPELAMRLQEDVWPAMMVKAIREHYSLGEDINIKACVGEDGDGDYRAEVWVESHHGKNYLYSHWVDGLDSFGIDHPVEWAETLNDRALIDLYLRIAHRKLAATDPYVQVGADRSFSSIIRDGLWVLYGIYAFRPRSRRQMSHGEIRRVGVFQTFEMPLEYRTDSQKAISFLTEHLEITAV